MAQVCEICGKGPMHGNRISHAHNVTKRRWNPNLRRVRALVKGAHKTIRVHRRPWAARTIRAFAIVNVLLVMFGLYFLVRTVLRAYAMGAHHDPLAYYAQAFYGKSIVNLLFLIALVAGSAFLWRVGRRGLLICNIVFTGEILYFLATSAFEVLSAFAGGQIALVGDSMAAVAGTGDMGINAQLLTAYPIIALIVLNTAYRKLHRVKA